MSDFLSSVGALFVFIVCIVALMACFVLSVAIVHAFAYVVYFLTSFVVYPVYDLVLEIINGTIVY